MFRKRRGKVFATLSEQEVLVLKRLMIDYEELLDKTPSNDPVIKRLYPAASLDDPKVAAEFDDLSHSELAASKSQTLSSVRAFLENYRQPKTEEVDATTIEMWLRLLSDMRLGIGVKIGVTEEIMSAPLDVVNEKNWDLAMLHWLGWMQEELIQASSPAGGSSLPGVP